MKKLKIFAMLAIMIMSIFTSVVSAADKGPMPIQIENVWINDKPINDNIVRADIERGDSIDVEVQLYAEETLDGIQVEFSIDGYEHADKVSTEAKTSTFDVEAGETHYKEETLTLPEEMDANDEYVLRIEITDKDHQKEIQNYILKISTPEHSLKIDDVLFSPGTTVQAGRSLLTSVRLENFGEKDEDNVKVTFSIPELGVADYDYIEEIEADDEKMTQELYVRIPADAENKDYEAIVSADYDDGYETVTKKFTFTVIGGQPSVAEAGKTVLTVGPETQNVVAGGDEAVYPIAITNSGSESRTYTLGLTIGDWATSRLSENVLVIQPGETKVAYAYVAADKDAAAGEKVVALKVTSGDMDKEVSLKANVVDNSNGWDTMKKALEIGLVVLVILLVVIGLIVGFSRLKNKEDEDEDEDKTYY